MANWTAITVSNLNNAKVSALVDALRTAALGAGQTDRSTEIIEGVVKAIRLEVQACKTNLVDADTTKIPTELRPIAVRMVLWELKNALEMSVTNQEEIDHGNDIKFLRRIAICEVPISTPDDPQETPTVQPAAGTPRITERARKFTRNDQEGI